VSYQAASIDAPLASAVTATDESDASSALQLNGMPVNDATRYAEPEPFQPAGVPINISDLPPANTNAPSFLRFISPKPANATAAPPAAPATTTTSNAAWQTR
jgi:hypothetical protein